MVTPGSLLGCILSPALLVAYIVNNPDPENKKRVEDEGYEGD